MSKSRKNEIVLVANVLEKVDITHFNFYFHVVVFFKE